MYVRRRGLGNGSPTTGEVVAQQGGVPAPTPASGYCGPFGEGWTTGTSCFDEAVYKIMHQPVTDTAVDVISEQQYGTIPTINPANITPVVTNVPATPTGTDTGVALAPGQSAGTLNTPQVQGAAESADIQAAEDAGTYDPTGNATAIGGAVTFGENVSTAFSDLFSGNLSNTDLEYLLIIAALGVGAFLIIPPLLRR